MTKNYASADAKKMLAEVDSSRAFNVKDGSEVKSLKDLYAKLQKMEDTTFEHHVSEERHDFGNWVKDVHKDYKLANSLFSSKTKQECAKAVGDRLYELQRNLNPTKPKKSSRFSETETAAERLEKILNEAAKVKMDKRKQEKEISSGTESSKVVDIDEGSVFDFKKDSSKPRIRNEPFTVGSRKTPSSSFISATEESPIEKNVKAETEAADEALLAEPAPKEVDPCEELIEFAEEPTDPKKVAGEIKSIFSTKSLKEFGKDMKTMFASSSPSEEIATDEKDDTEDGFIELQPDTHLPTSEPKPIPEPGPDRLRPDLSPINLDDTVTEQEAVPEAPDTMVQSADKDAIISHLKKVFK